ncbi:MAG: M3 family metallopeptidase [Fimbriimonadales bacterium]
MAAAAFTQEVPANVVAALKKADAAVAKIIAIPDGERNFDNTIGALDDISTQLDTDTSLTLFMQFVSTDAKVRDGARAAEEAVSNWGIDLGKREDLFRAVKAYADTKPNLSGEQKRLLDFTMRDYRRAGMDLPLEKRNQLKQIEMEINKLSIEFETNINEDATKLALTTDELKGVPKSVVDRLPKLGNVVLMGFDGPTYGAVMDYCEVDATRQKAQWLYRRRGGQKNVEVLEKLLKLRTQESELLGYKNFVDYAIETRMAHDAATVKKFYDDLLPIVNAKAAQDVKEFLAFKRAQTKNPKATFNPWDYSFYKNLLKKEKYAVDGEKVAEYFPMERVVEGLFKITSSLYNIEYRDVTKKAGELGLPIWHADVKLYEVVDKANGEVLGHLYTDLYPRDNKYSHAACWGLWQRKVWADGTVQKPLAALVCNFTKPTPTTPSLLPHDEVETFFHEFGHGLHQMLTNTKYGRFSGTAVARDFVEAPSQMMENWVWNASVLKTFAKHYKTGQPLPDKLLAGMQAARTLGSGIETQGQFFLGQMDQKFHLAPKGEVDTTKVAQQVYESIMPYKFLPMTFPQAAFGHLTGYEGAYYGYMWSLVYAQDMFQRFEELGVTSPKAGLYYREKILGRGGSMDEMDMLRDYLGRAPKMDAFMKHLGLKQPPAGKKK